ncbi:MAG: hypothetical protein RIT26_35 [Pseudomonadota bacterium]
MSAAWRVRHAATPGSQGEKSLSPILMPRRQWGWIKTLITQTLCAYPASSSHFLSWASFSAILISNPRETGAYQRGSGMPSGK